MVRVVNDNVVESSTTTGTGAFTLAGALVGCQRFDDCCSVGDLVYYMIEAVDGSGNRTGQWEVGSGTYSATDTLTRDVFYDGSGWPTFTNFSAGTKRVSIAYISRQARFRGALIYKGSDQTAANFTTLTAMTFDSESYDTEGFHDTVSNTSRLTVPAGVTKVRLTGHARVSSHTANKYTSLFISKNGSYSYVGQVGQVMYSDLTVVEVAVTSPVLDVTAGDYFELGLEIETDTSVTVEGTRTWFAMEVIQ